MVLSRFANYQQNIRDKAVIIIAFFMAGNLKLNRKYFSHQELCKKCEVAHHIECHQYNPTFPLAL
jgi:hypothetical protein